MHKGTLVLTPFPFTDLSGHKVRPALILHNNIKGEDCIVMFVSSVIQENIGPYDVRAKISTQNGLKVDSVIKINKIATLQKKVVLGELGTLESSAQKEVDKKLASLLKL